jgi:hypothetical protein
MPYPETTDAFTVTDIKNWSTFKRQEVGFVCNIILYKYTERLPGSSKTI